MNNQEKTKEEYVKELHELQQLYSALKVLNQNEIDARKKAEDTLKKIGCQAKIGTWEYNNQNSKLICSNEVYRIFEISDTTELNLDELLDYFTVESSEIIRRAIKLAVEQGKSFIRDSEIKTKSGKLKWVRTQGEVIKNEKTKAGYIFGTIQDISEIRLIDTVTKESELTLSQVEQITHIGHWSVNLIDGSFYHSDEIKRIFGYEPSEYALSVEEAINAYHPDDREDVVRYFNRAAETGEGYEFDLRIIQPSGDIRHVHSIGYTEKNDEGKVTRVYGVFQDITDIKQSVRMLEQSEMLLNASLESQKDTILLSIDTEYRYLFFNKTSAENMKIVYGADIQIGKNILDYITSDEDRQAAKENYDRALNGESHSNIREYGMEKKAWFESFFNPIRNSQNEIIGATAMARNITERKQLEDIIIESSNRYHALIEQAGDGIFTLDIKGNLISLNETYARMHGYSMDEMKNISLKTLDVEGDSKFPERIQRIVNGETLSFEVEHYHKDGHVFPLLVTANLVTVGSEKLIIAIHRDLTERKLVEQKLEKALKKATESDRLKSAFLANMSHEIRTPMNGILGFSELLKEPELTGEKQKEYLNVIEKSGERMLNIINDIIDISKIESGQIDVVIENLNIPDQLDYIYTFFKPEVEAKGIKLLLKDEVTPIQAIIQTDHEKLFVVLTNLVKNAIKFTDHGLIELGCKLKGKFLEFYVKDTGVGIPLDRQTAIFDRFVQADLLDSRAFQGAGLGLSISKAYVEKLGGKIWLESEKGKGSIFYFTIPYVRENNSENKEEKNDIADKNLILTRKLKTLIAEDDEYSKLYILEMIESYCKEILYANDGVEAIETCRNNPDLDLILMDIKMPRMNGYLAARQIREFNNDVIIIAQTAFAFAGDKEKALNAGCNDYISKPIKQASILALIQKYFTKKLINEQPSSSGEIILGEM